MTTKQRGIRLTTDDLHRLDVACRPIVQGLGVPYLVGSAGDGEGAYRDVDVRLILADDKFDQVCPTRDRWELLCITICAYLIRETGLPIDFQIQRMTEANEKHPGKPRNPLGMKAGRVFAGGGDATPDW